MITFRLLASFITLALPLNVLGNSSDEIMLVHNDKLYHYTANSNSVTTTAQFALVDINQRITSGNFDMLLTGPQCGDFKNYLFSPVDNQSCVLGIGDSLFLFNVSKGLISKSTSSTLQLLSSDHDKIIAFLCDGTHTAFTASLDEVKPNRSYDDELSTCLLYHPVVPLAGYCTYETTNTVKLIDSETGDVKLETEGSSLVFMSEFALVKSNTNAHWKIYSLEHFDYVNDLASDDISVSPDASILLVWDNLRIVQNGKMPFYLRRFKVDENIQAAAFSPDNERLFVLTEEIRYNKDHSTIAEYLLYRFDLSSNDVNGKVILKLAGNPVHGHRLWIFEK